VLLDLKLPLVSGLEVLEWIRSQSAHQTLVVVVFSSSANPQDVRSAYQLGANAFAVKPADAHRRLEFAQVLCGWWFAFAELPLE
jgi:CheY-like chemotaxis protein